MLKPKQTTRKFYNKWLYKVTLNIPGVALFRLHKLEDIPFLKFDSGNRPHSLMAKATANKEFIIHLSKVLVEFDKDLWAKRIENSSIDIYTNTPEIFETVLEEMKDVVYSCFAPSDTDKNILESSGSIVAKKLPHGRYAFKAFLLPHKLKDRVEKQRYLDWIDQQGEKIRISKTVKDWFITTEWNWDRRYILVEDEATLLMLKLRNAELLGRVYDYVISDK